MLNKEELINVFDDFINENGLWDVFIEYLNKLGYSEEEIYEIEDFLNKL